MMVKKIAFLFCRLASAGIFLTLLLLAAQPAWADLERGMAALKAGDFKAAYAELLPSAEAGDAAAQYEIGLMRDSGYGVAEGPHSAAHCFRAAAEHGHDRAQHAIATYYEPGKGVEQDFAQAAHWYGLSAEQGNAKAARNLGNLYLEGQGVALDHIRAAEKGHAEGQIYVARMLARGDGVEQDLAEAWFWFTITEAQSPDTARYYLDKYRDVLDATHKEAAQLRARLWMPRN